MGRAAGVDGRVVCDRTDPRDHVRHRRDHVVAPRPAEEAGAPGGGRDPVGATLVVAYEVSIFSMTPRLAASISAIFDGSLPPASAKSGRPPPPPPTIGASFLTT